MSAHLDSTYGAAFIGMVVGAVLHGVTCVQALYYYMNQNDRWFTKYSVTAVVIFDTIHQALITHTVYTYTVTNWGNPAQLDLIIWSLKAEVIFNAMTALIVQCFLTLRIWRLSNRNISITASCGTLAVAGFVTALVYVAKAFEFKTLPELVHIKGESIAVNVLGAATDLLIAGTLCILLNFSRTGFQRSDAVINKLIMFSVNTGLLTSLCALASLISILAAPDTFIYIAFFFCLGRLYTNSLLATLNARKVLARVAEGGTTSVSLPDLSKRTLPQISVKIDTEKQEYNRSPSPAGDQTLRDETSEPVNIYNTHVVSYDEEDGRKEPQY